MADSYDITSKSSYLKRHQDVFGFVGLKPRKRVVHGRVACCAETNQEENNSFAVPHHKQLSRSKDSSSISVARSLAIVVIRYQDCSVNRSALCMHVTGFWRHTVNLYGSQLGPCCKWDPHVHHVRHYSLDQACPISQTRGKDLTYVTNYADFARQTSYIQTSRHLNKQIPASHVTP